MSDEIQPSEAPQSEPATASEKPPIETATPPAAETPPTPRWQEVVDKTDPKELRTHPRIVGLVGSMMQAERERQKRDEAGQRREETEGELLKFFEENEDYVRQHYPKAHERYREMQTERAHRDVEGLRGKTRHELATAIGRAYQDVPEWKELTDADHETLAKAVMNKHDDEVIPIFTRHALDLVAERRAQRKLTDWKEKELAKEREAIRQEEAAKLLAGSEAPDTTRPKGHPAKVNPGTMTTDEFDREFPLNVPIADLIKRKFG